MPYVFKKVKIMSLLFSYLATQNQNTTIPYNCIGV